MLVRDGHDDADGDEEEACYAEGEEEAVPGEVDFWVAGGLLGGEVEPWSWNMEMGVVRGI